jgi:hypothetical protein
MSASVSFATLEDVALRTAWAHEALGFTPWLAQNLDRLAQAIGLPALELVDTEVPVGRYSADILARNPVDDTLVLVENQLEHGDHGHLGQILTYLTGLRAHTVVWVAADFRDEHLSAINWLNQNTIDPFAFFAVRLRVVRIADSPLAPLFEVVERPNGWDRRIQEAARESAEPSSLNSLRNVFFDLFRGRHPDIEVSRGAGGSIWHSVAGLDLVLSLFWSKHHVGIFVRGGRGRSGDVVAPLLAPHTVELERRLGARFGGQEGYPLHKTYKTDTSDRANWPQMADWLAAECHSYEAALRDVLMVDGSMRSAIPQGEV